jgi:predicted RNase H-like nuclease (RuvC/YqgF family)
LISINEFFESTFDRDFIDECDKDYELTRLRAENERLRKELQEAARISHEYRDKYNRARDLLAAYGEETDQ